MKSLKKALRRRSSPTADRSRNLITPTSSPSGNVQWALDDNALKELRRYEESNPDRGFHQLLEHINSGADILSSFINVIPNEPVPAKALVQLVLNIAKLAQVGLVITNFPTPSHMSPQESREASKELVDLGRHILQFVERVISIAQSDDRHSAFTAAMWNQTSGIK